jgi:DNA-directed RNA polymerase alpha subunit
VTLEISIDELELGVHASNLLKASGVSTVFDLEWLSAEELAGLPNMNQKTFDEILDALAARGLTLR